MGFINLGIKIVSVGLQLRLIEMHSTRSTVETWPQRSAVSHVKAVREVGGGRGREGGGWGPGPERRELWRVQSCSGCGTAEANGTPAHLGDLSQEAPKQRKAAWDFRNPSFSNVIQSGS